MKNEFLAHIGTDSIKFGTTRSELRKIVQSPYVTFLRGQFATNTTDYYEILGFFVEYDNNDCVDALEFRYLSNLIYEGSDLLKMKFSELKKKFNDISKNKIEDGITVLYHDFGIGLTKATERDTCETIIIYSPKYWSE